MKARAVSWLWRMTRRVRFRYFRASPEIIRLAVMLDVRLLLSLRNFEDPVHERGIDVSHVTICFWWNRYGLSSAAQNWANSGVCPWVRTDQVAFLTGRGIAFFELIAAQVLTV